MTRPAPPPETRALICDLVEWLAPAPRAYAEAIAAWRTSCPRLPVWEDAIDLELVVVERQDGCGTVVKITPAGRDFLKREGRQPGA